MVSLTKLWNPLKGQLDIAGLISGKGSNLVKIIEHEQSLKEERGMSPYHVAIIFSDRKDSFANEIAAENGIPDFTYDLEGFCRKRGVDIKDMNARREYENQALRVLVQFHCPVFAYAGYMRKATEYFVNSAIGVNVHPADLTIIGEDAKRKYTGDKAVLKALRAGERELRSTTHIVTLKVDDGPILMVSRPIEVYKSDLQNQSEESWERVANMYQNRLKEKGDWEIFPRTLEYIADGRFAKDIDGNLYFDEKPIPNGVRLERE